MIRLLRWLWFGDAHIHMWSYTGKTDIHSDNQTLPIAILMHSTCTICGKVKTRRVKD